jgi:hypothetical protein
VIWEIEDGPRAVEGLDERGRPRPEYAAALGLVSAPLGRRVLATVYEGLLVLLLQVPMFVFAFPALVDAALSENPVDTIFGRDDALWIVLAALVPYALTTAFILLQLVLLGRGGVTLGKAMTGLRAINVATLEKPKFWRGAVVRYLVQVGSFLIPLLGPLLVIALSPLFDPERRRRGWSDLAAGTWLVDIKLGLNPYDAKRMRIARKTVATDLTDEKTALPSLATPISAPLTDVYIPVARNRGGVVGAPRERAPGAPADPAPDAGPMAPIQASPFADGPAVAPLPTRGPQVPVVPAARTHGPVDVAALPEVSMADAAAPPAARHDPLAVSSETLLPRGETTSWSPPSLMDAPAEAPAAAPAPAAPQRAASLVLDTGETITVTDAGVVLGRSPSPAGDDGGAVAVPVADPSMSISKTHVALRWSGGALVAVDLGSTNGSAIIRDGAEHELPPGEAAGLRTGDTLRFGDRHATVGID